MIEIRNGHVVGAAAQSRPTQAPRQQADEQNENRIDAIAEILRCAAEDQPALYYCTAFEQGLNEQSRISRVSDDISRLLNAEQARLALSMVAIGVLIAVPTSHNDGWLFTPSRAERGVDGEVAG